LAGWLAGFDFQFLSFQMGYVKPDREVFVRTAQLLDRPRESVLFLDDNAINVEVARAAGFHERPTSSSEVPVRRHYT
jgi:putative hydrolase of the HAD superfamily